MTPEERAATVVAELENLELLNLYPAEREDIETPIAAAICEAQSAARRECVEWLFEHAEFASNKGFQDEASHYRAAAEYIDRKAAPKGGEKRENNANEPNNS